MINKKAQISNNELGTIIIAGLLGILVGYFLWGQSYTTLNNNYKNLQEDYFELNEKYLSLEANYTQLKKDTETLLIKYQQCVGRENFFTWVDRISSLASLAKFIGII